MYDWKLSAELSAQYWDSVPTDNPNTINGFNGTFNFSSHELIPSALRNFITEYFYKYARFSRIPLDEINNVLNEVWEGPGSMSKIVRLTGEVRDARRKNIDTEDVKVSENDVPAYEDDDDDLEIEIDIAED